MCQILVVLRECNYRLIDFSIRCLLKSVLGCLSCRPRNGGLIDLEELRGLLAKRRRGVSITEDDCLRAIGKLKKLGGGYEVFSVGRRKLVRSVPMELNRDHNLILEIAQPRGHVTVEEVERELSWRSGRAIDALELLLKEGLAMVDDGDPDGKRHYWFPCVGSSSPGDAEAE